MRAAVAEIVVRWATEDDLPRIRALRALQERANEPPVPMLANLLWLVAEEDSGIHACGGGVLAANDQGGATAIITDLLDDGTLAGKRGLLALLDDAMTARNVDLYVTIPKDREELVKALCDRGLELDGFQLRKRRDPDAIE